MVWSDFRARMKTVIFQVQKHPSNFRHFLPILAEEAAKKAKVIRAVLEVLGLTVRGPIVCTGPTWTPWMDLLMDPRVRRKTTCPTSLLDCAKTPAAPPYPPHLVQEVILWEVSMITRNLAPCTRRKLVIRQKIADLTRPDL